MEGELAAAGLRRLFDFAGKTRPPKRYIVTSAQEYALDMICLNPLDFSTSQSLDYLSSVVTRIYLPPLVQNVGVRRAEKDRVPVVDLPLLRLRG